MVDSKKFADEVALKVVAQLKQDGCSVCRLSEQEQKILGALAASWRDKNFASIAHALKTVAELYNKIAKYIGTAVIVGFFIVMILILRAFGLDIFGAGKIIKP